MSEDVSDWYSVDEEERTSRYEELAQKTGFALDDILNGTVKVLEHRSLGWQSTAVSVYNIA